MGNYKGTTRSNYFRVTNEVKFEELCEGLNFDGEKAHLYFDIIDSEKHYCIAGYGSLDFIPVEERGKENPEHNLEGFIFELQKLLPEDEAVIIQEAGHEKLRYIAGYATVITAKSYEVINLETLAIAKAREMLGNKNFTTYI